MLFSLITGLILGAAGVIFAFQNVFPVTVTFLGWELSASLAVIVILSLIIGALTSILMTVPGAIQNYFTISHLKRENKKLVKEVVSAKEEINSPVPRASQPPQE